MLLSSCARWWATDTCRTDSDCVAPHVCVANACVAPERAAPDAGAADAGPKADGGACLDLIDDPQNCGVAGHSCSAGQLCIRGACTSSSDCFQSGCPAPRTYCDINTGVCRTGCASDAVCGTGRLCDNATHECVPSPANCLTQACPAGHRCDETSAQCVVGCTTAADCGPNVSCAAGVCLRAPPECPWGTCPGGLYCDPAARTCVAGCADGVPCANGGICDTATHACGSPPSLASCLTNGCLATNEYCDVARGACRVGCAGTMDCNGHEYCDPQTHSCKTPPATCPTAGCPYGSHCAAGACVAGCGTVGDCGYGAICLSGECVPVPPDCSLTGCAAGQYCDPIALACKPGCTSDASCPAGSACSTSSLQCVASAPDCTTQHCPAGQICDPADGLCKVSCGSGESCPSSGTCDSATNTCVSSCSPATCTAGNRCDPLRGCVPGCDLPAYPCPMGSVCDLATRACIAPPVASCSTTCTPGTWCSGTTCGRCVTGCDATQPCPTGQVCDLAAHACYLPNDCASLGQADCGGTCADLSTDPKNCGDCGIACPLTMPACLGGSCYDPCPAQNKVDCAGTCSDTMTDPMNCGACGHACPTAMPACMSGSCYDPCPAEGKTNCNGTCTLTNGTDAMNCGACGHACPTAMPACMSGSCYDPCPAEGKTNCNGTCTVTNGTDAMNCGACGHACPTAMPACMSGSCYDPCPAEGKTNCNGTCAATMTDAMNCGTCGNVCPSGSPLCSGGTCSACPSGQAFCSGACTTTQTDLSNCGTCGNVCGANMGCVSGQCMSVPCTGTAPTKACQNCGTETQTCNGVDGTWTGGWGACTGQGECDEYTTQSCGGGQVQLCSDSCQWGSCFTPCESWPPSQSCPIGQVCAPYNIIDGKCTTPRYTVSDGTVLDSVTGYTWEQNVFEVTDWETAGFYCSSLSLGPYSSGWYLPEQYALFSIVEMKSSPPMIDTNVFGYQTSTNTFWSNTLQDNQNGWYVVDFSSGEVYNGPSDINATNPVRCVHY